MRKFIRYVTETLFICIILITVTVVCVLRYPKNTFHASYQSMIQNKFFMFKKMTGPKIIIVSGSSSAFGLDQKMLEEATGYKVANLGLHAGFGALFYSELAKANITAGDIVLLGYEYSWRERNGLDRLGTDLVMSGIDHHISMYRYIPLTKWGTIIGNIFSYAYKKKSYEPAHGIYSRESFNSDTGQMTKVRNDKMRYNRKIYGSIDISNYKIPYENIKYMKGLRKYIERKNAKVYFIAPPLVKNAIIGDVNNLYKIKEIIEKDIGIKYISDPVKYLFPEELMDNALYHCNSKGEKIRTQMLIDDLVNAGIIKSQKPADNSDND